MKPTKTIAWLALAALMTAVGVTHFTATDLYVAFMPKWLPAPRALVYLSGVAEIALGLALLWPRTTRLAGFGIIALLVAVYPANINHAVVGGIDDPSLPALFADPVVAWLRLPLQFLFIAWAWWLTRPPHPGTRPTRTSP